MKGKYLILGSNLGNREAVLGKARNMIAENIGPVLRTSSIYETAPWGYNEQPAFLNQVIEIQTEMDPFEVLKRIQRIEGALGRVRYGKWKERIIDIDILYFEDQQIHSEQLILPHPGIPDRRFVLVPLTELAPDEIHPVLGLSNRNLLEATDDRLSVEKIA